MWLRLARSWETITSRIDALPAWLALLLGVAVALLAWLAPGAIVLVPLLLVAAGALAFTAQPLAVPVEGVTAPPGTIPRKYEFDVVTLDARGDVKEQRRATARGWAERLPEGALLEMVEVPGGTFLMGSPRSEAGRAKNEGPQHRVTVPAFAIGRFPVTQAQWRAIASLPKVDRELKRWPAHFRFRGGDRPVEQVSWHDTVEFCARLTKVAGRLYRLPSEAEWEYAARAGTTTPFHFGETITPKWVNYDGARTIHVGGWPLRVWRLRRGTLANAFGLCDAHGNVWEWCQDPWHDDYIGALNDAAPWNDGNDTPRRVLRGGAWNGNARNCRSAARGRGGSERRGSHVGVRVVCVAAGAAGGE